MRQLQFLYVYVKFGAISWKSNSNFKKIKFKSKKKKEKEKEKKKKRKEKKRKEKKRKEKKRKEKKRKEKKRKEKEKRKEKKGKERKKKKRKEKKEKKRKEKNSFAPYVTHRPINVFNNSTQHFNFYLIHFQSLTDSPSKSGVFTENTQNIIYLEINK